MQGSTTLQNILAARKKDFPLWAFLSLVHTMHPKDMVPYNTGIHLLYEWLAPIQPADQIPRTYYPPFMCVRYCAEIMSVLGTQYDCAIQYSALNDPHIDTKNFFR